MVEKNGGNCLISVRQANRWATKEGFYTFEKELGKGTFGTVLLALQGKFGQRVAVTLVQLPCGGTISRENVLVHHHKNIVRVVDCYECYDPPINRDSVKFSPKLPSPTAIAVVMQYCISKDLASYLQSYRVNEVTRLRWYRELALGLQYLHENDCIHWSLNPSSVWINDDSLKIAYAGFSQLVYNNYCNKHVPLTYGEFMSQFFKDSVPFLPPEAWTVDYNERSDVFSLALLYLVIAESPDEGHHKAKWGEKVDHFGYLLYRNIPPRNLKPTHLFAPPISTAKHQETNLFDKMLQFDSYERSDLEFVVNELLKMKPGGSLKESWATWCAC